MRERQREPLVVAWGRVQYEKGFQVLTRAIGHLRHRIPDIRCVIAGRGSYIAELQTQIDMEGVSDIVQLAGFVPDEELRALLQRTGCVVIPSLYEPFGLVALEAMASGCPCIVADTGGLREVASTRVLIAAGRLVAEGLPMHQAAKAAIAGPLTDDVAVGRALGEMIEVYLGGGG